MFNDSTESAAHAPLNFVFVHGAWHSGRHWYRVTDLLAKAGHHVVAVDLPGCEPDIPFTNGDLSAERTSPSPIRHIGLSDYCEAVASTVRKRTVHGPVILVGHSIGGLTITRVGDAVPDAIKRLVYVTAYVPVRMASAIEYRTLPESNTSLTDGILIGDPSEIGAFRINPRPNDIPYLERIRQAYYHDVTMEEFLAFAALLKPDLPAKIATDDARGTTERWGSIPRTFIRCTEDRGIVLALQDRMIKEADEATPTNKFDIRTLASSHSPFASVPDEFTAILTTLDK